ncbi:MAG: RDD family protein [Candidatus Lambdaproteobacteria bacterium]|nr:RDD family protein [Candidatus Lambdaproteobacteria bacterium]
MRDPTGIPTTADPGAVAPSPLGAGTGAEVTPTALAGQHLRLFALLFDYVLIVTALKLLDQLTLGEHWDLRAHAGLLGGQPWPWALGTLGLLLAKDLAGGRSLGKWLTGIAVRRADAPAAPPAAGALLLRNATLPLLPVEALLVFTDPYTRRLGDRLAGTVCVAIAGAASIFQRLLLAASLLLGFLLATFLLTPWNLHRSSAYQEAVRLAGAAPALAETLGAPATLGDVTTVQIDTGQGAGAPPRALLAFGAKGPRGGAEVTIRLRQPPGERRWVVEGIQVTPQALPRPPLTAPAPLSPAPPSPVQAR